MEISKENEFNETTIKPFEKETLLYSISKDNKWIVAMGNSKKSLVVLSVEKNFEIVQTISFGLFDRKWDTILSSNRIKMDILSEHLVCFYSEKLTFRFINFAKPKKSKFNFLEQNKFSKFEIKPSLERDLLPYRTDEPPQPLLVHSTANENNEIVHSIVC